MNDIAIIKCKIVGFEGITQTCKFSTMLVTILDEYDLQIA